MHIHVHYMKKAYCKNRGSECEGGRSDVREGGGREDVGGGAGWTEEMKQVANRTDDISATK